MLHFWMILPFAPAGAMGFNGHPPLGVNATYYEIRRNRYGLSESFNGHPPLGVNATTMQHMQLKQRKEVSFNRHPPLGVNATV